MTSTTTSPDRSPLLHVPDHALPFSQGATDFEPCTSTSGRSVVDTAAALSALVESHPLVLPADGDAVGRLADGFGWAEATLGFVGDSRPADSLYFQH